MNWLIDYNHPVDMTRNYYLDWRPSYRNILEMDNPVVVEVGVLEGFNTYQALKYLKFGKYYLVDCYKKYDSDDVGGLHLYTQERWDDLYLRTKERFKDYPEVEFIRKTSEEASRDFKDGSLDFVYIDADHSYKGICKDLNLWYPKVKKNGILAGHDFDLENVQSAVYKFFLENYVGKETGNNFDALFFYACNDWWMKKE